MGELWVHSPNMSSGYYKDSEQTQQCFVREGSTTAAEGASTSGSGAPRTGTSQGLGPGTGAGRVWYRTGDLVRVLDPGQFRSTAIINTHN